MPRLDTDALVMLDNVLDMICAQAKQSKPAKSNSVLWYTMSPIAIHFSITAGCLESIIELIVSDYDIHIVAHGATLDEARRRVVKEACKTDGRRDRVVLIDRVARLVVYGAEWRLRRIFVRPNTWQNE